LGNWPLAVLAMMRTASLYTDVVDVRANGFKQCWTAGKRGAVLASDTISATSVLIQLRSIDMTTIDYETKYAKDFVDLDLRYTGVESFIKQMAAGKVRSLIVNGPPGVGKTYHVEKYLTQYCTNEFKSVSGHMTLLSLYAALYAYRAAGKIFVLDDADSIYSKVEGLNILKAAMDTKSNRVVSWESSSGVLNTMGLPQNFEFDGGVILITNVGFHNGSGKLMTHLNALKDRSFCIPIGDAGEDSLFKQICYMVFKRDLLTNCGIPLAEQLALVDYISENRKRLYTVSLRTVVKLADIYKMDPINWRTMADQGLVKVAN